MSSDSLIDRRYELHAPKTPIDVLESYTTVGVGRGSSRVIGTRFVGGIAGSTLHLLLFPMVMVA